MMHKIIKCTGKTEGRFSGSGKEGEALDVTEVRRMGQRWARL